jgi:transposase
MKRTAIYARVKDRDAAIDEASKQRVPVTQITDLRASTSVFEFVREQLRDSYSETGRPSIDPELLLRILLIGYLYGITSERKLVEELRMHLAWRWVTGLALASWTPGTLLALQTS